MLKTWDIFDTLITRRCVAPQIIFHLVEEVSKVKGFTQKQIEAERNVSRRGNYNLDDIYEELQKLTNAPENFCDTLKNIECDAEFSQCIPITENIQQVKSGDILISDMYLPETIIRRLLNKAGLVVPVEILITSGGKSSGQVWKQFAEQEEFLFHVGDNNKSDVENPRLVGFESALSVLSNSTDIEQDILNKDFNFGAYLREIRLRNPFSDEMRRIYWQLFTLNIGILILLVQQIDALQKKCGFEYLGFCGRDTHYLRLLYEKYKFKRGETPTPNDYLYYSRKLVRNSGDDLAKYFSAKINNRKALMIDLFGSGVHLNNLRKNFNVPFSILMCFISGKDLGKKIYPNMLQIEGWTSAFDKASDMPTDNANIFLLDTAGKINEIWHVECLNRATHNSPIRLKALSIGEKIIPKVTFSETNDTENFDVFESCLHEVLSSKLVLPSHIAKNSTQLENLLLPLLKGLTSSSVSLPLRNQHQLNEKVDNQMLKLLQK